MEDNFNPEQFKNELEELCTKYEIHHCSFSGTRKYRLVGFLMPGDTYQLSDIAFFVENQARAYQFGREQLHFQLDKIAKIKY